MTDTPLVEVTQAIRDEAANAVIVASDRTLEIRMGERDDDPIVQAIARIAHQSPTSVSREAVAVELAGHFALRPWADMAEDRCDLRDRFRNEQPAVPFDINEPTRSDCRDAADALLSLSEKGS